MRGEAVVRKCEAGRPEPLLRGVRQKGVRCIGNVLTLRNEAAFSNLVRSHQCAMLRIAMTYVSNRAIAEEVVQDTWMNVYEGLGSFQGRSSLETWMFGILKNRARLRRTRESRVIPFSSLKCDAQGHGCRCLDAGCALDGYRLYSRSSAPWTERAAEKALLDREALEIVASAIGQLPATQRQVIVMRDIDGSTSTETCIVLSLSKVNQRVLLHRARARVRVALAKQLAH